MKNETATPAATRTGYIRDHWRVAAHGALHNVALTPIWFDCEADAREWVYQNLPNFPNPIFIHNPASWAVAL